MELINPSNWGWPEWIVMVTVLVNTAGSIFSLRDGIGGLIAYLILQCAFLLALFSTGGFA